MSTAKSKVLFKICEGYYYSAYYIFALFPSPLEQKKTDKPAPIIQPIGHASHIPTVPSGAESITAKTTLNIKSVKVAVINAFIFPAPRSIPSATNFEEATE